METYVLGLLAETSEASPRVVATLVAQDGHKYAHTTMRVHLLSLCDQGLVTRKNIGSDRNPCWAYWKIERAEKSD